MKVVRGFLRLISIVLLIGIVGFVTYFGLVTNGIIDSPYDKKAEIISLSQSEIRLRKNKSYQLTSVVYPEKARGSKVKYESNNPDIVSINEVTGYLETKKNGVATITASVSANKDVKAECLVIVSENNVKVTKITASPKTINLQVGKRYQVKYKLTPREATIHEIEYYTSDPSVATVNKNGLIETVGEGMAIINISDKVTGIYDDVLVKVYAKSNSKNNNSNNNNSNNNKNNNNNKTKSYDDDSNKEVDPTGIEVSNKKITVSIGGSIPIEAKVIPANANQKITWESLDTNVATVNSKGVVTGIRVGTTKVIGTTINGKEVMVDINVTNKEISPTKITVKKTDVKLDIGKSENIEYKVLPDNATNKGIEVLNSNSKVVRMDGTRIIALDSGRATITLKIKQSSLRNARINTRLNTSLTTLGNNDKVDVQVINVYVNKASTIIPETDIILSTNNLELEVGETSNVTANVVPSNATYKDLIWEVTDPSIVSVDNGLVKGLSAGSTTIIVTSHYKKISKTINVKVSNVGVKAVTVDPRSKTLNVGETYQLTATIIPYNASNKNMQWSSSDTSVATVSNNGLVTAKKAGTAVIEVSVGNKSDKCRVTVNSSSSVVDVTSVTLNKNNVNLKVGESLTLIATVEPSNATNKSISWSSSNSNVVTVSNGVVVAKSSGLAIVTASSNNGKTATCGFIVSKSINDNNDNNGNTGTNVSNTYSINYKANGGTGSMTSHTCTTNSSCTIKSNSFTRSGYTFVGWTTNSNGTDDGYGWTGWSGTWKYTNGQYGISNNTLNLYARWKQNSSSDGGSGETSTTSYTIKYNGNGATGGSVSSHTCTTNSSCTIQSNGFTRSGYTFVGWTTNSNGTDDGYGWTGWSGTWKYTNGQYGISNNTLNLYARWKQNSSSDGGSGGTSTTSYTIKYNGNGATGGSVSSHTCTTNGSCTIQSNGFTRSGYTFAGWTTNSNGTDDGYGWTGWSGTWKYTNGQYGISNNTLNLYARWTAQSNSGSDSGTGYGSGYVIATDSKYNSYTEVASCDSSTLKYKIINLDPSTKGKFAQYYALIWVANSNEQFITGLADPTDAVGGNEARKIFENEVSRYSYQNKCLVGTNGSIFEKLSPKDNVVISRGKIIKNTGTANQTIGIPSKGSWPGWIKEYISSSPYSANDMINEGVKNTATEIFRVSSLSSTEGTDKTLRTMICQLDEHNFVLYSGYGKPEYRAYEIKNRTGCSWTFNLDGGGSREMHYKTKGSSSVTELYTAGLYAPQSSQGRRSIPDVVYFAEQ